MKFTIQCVVPQFSQSQTTSILLQCCKYIEFIIVIGPSGV